MFANMYLSKTWSCDQILQTCSSCLIYGFFFPKLWNSLLVNMNFHHFFSCKLLVFHLKRMMGGCESFMSLSLIQKWTRETNPDDPWKDFIENFQSLLNLETNLPKDSLLTFVSWIYLRNASTISNSHLEGFWQIGMVD